MVGVVSITRPFIVMGKVLITSVPNFLSMQWPDENDFFDYNENLRLCGILDWQYFSVHYVFKMSYSIVFIVH